jgi:hypothetical protein
MNNTTRTEDKLIAACEDFGGKAGELVEIINRLDAMIGRHLDTIANMETDIARMEDEIEALEQELEGEQA